VTKISSILGYNHWGGTSPLYHPYTSAYTLIGARQHLPFLSFIHHPHQSSTRPHTRLHTCPTHSPSKEFRLHSLNHLQEFRLKLLIPFQDLRFDSRLRDWSSGPRAFSHPKFCGLILHIVHYPIPGLYLTPSGIFGFTLHIFQIQHDPVYVLTMCGVQSSGFFFLFFLLFFPSPCDLPVSCCLTTSVVRSRSTR